MNESGSVSRLRRNYTVAEADIHDQVATMDPHDPIPGTRAAEMAREVSGELLAVAHERKICEWSEVSITNGSRG